LKVFHKELVIDLVFFTKRSISYYNKYYNIELMLKKKHKINLIQRNIQTKQPNIKLDHKKLGLFKVKRVIGLVNYKLTLLKNINIHPVFYISFLELALLGALPVFIIEIEPINPNTEYKIKKILDHNRVRNYIKYLVK
jgi:hypothetical protein